MARQLIGIGSTANDGTGDTLRAALGKVNDNTLELYGDDLFYGDFALADYRDGTERVADFSAWLTALSGTFVRGGSDHRYIDSTGYLVNGSADTLRVAYDSLTGEAVGALLEPSRQNLLLYTDDISHGTWGFSNQNITKTADNTTGIEGTTTMGTVLETATANVLHRLWYYTASASYTSGNVYCFSVYVKQIGADRGFQLVPVAATGLGTTDVDLNSGTATNGWNMERLKDGIFRLWKSAEATSNGVANFQFLLTKAGSKYYTGSTNAGIGIEKIQYEQVSAVGDPPTSYIDNPTTTQNTRSADALTVDAPSGTFYFVYGNGEWASVAPGAGAYAVPTSSAYPVVRRITQELPEESVSNKKISTFLGQADVRGLTEDDGPEFTSLVVATGIIRMDADGSDTIKLDGGTVQLTTGNTAVGTFRGVVIGNNAAEDAVSQATFSNSISIGTDTASNATTFSSSTVINDTAAGQATTVQNSDIIGNEAGNQHTSITSCVFIGNFAGAGTPAGGDTAETSVAIGKEAARLHSLATSVVIGHSAADSGSGGSLTACVIIGDTAGDNITGAVSNLILIGRGVEAPTASTSDYLKIGDSIEGSTASGSETLRFRGASSAAGAPTTTELPTSRDWGIHKNTSSGNVYLAYNDGGSIVKVQLT